MLFGQKKKIALYLFMSMLIGHVNIFASIRCDSEKQLGLEITETPSGIKIISSAMVQVPLDNPILYQDAIREASMEAKANIASYFEETITRQCDITKTSKTNENIIDVNVDYNVKIDSDFSGEFNGKTRIADILKTKYQVCSLKSSTSKLFQKIEKLYSCYSKGNHVVVKLQAIFNE